MRVLSSSLGLVGQLHRQFNLASVTWQDGLMLPYLMANHMFSENKMMVFGFILSNSLLCWMFIILASKVDF